MKVTSYEISKKLAEIGFNPKLNYLHNATISERAGVQIDSYGCRDNFPERLIYRCFDLETLLEALPKVISGMPLKIRLDRSDHIGYSSSHEEEEQYVCFRRKGESLADTAARLLILLHDKGLVKFDQSIKE